MIDDTKAWLNKYVEGWSLGPNDLINVNTHVSLPWSGNNQATVVPIQFGEIKGEFRSGYSTLDTIEWLPRVIHGDFDCSMIPNGSMSGIHEHLQRLDGAWLGNARITHVLGVLLIPGITRIYFSNNDKVGSILNKYVGSRDILSAQDELIDAGFIDQARL